MLTAYRANPLIGPGPAEGSYAWKVEREIERRFKVAHAVVTNSGTAALHAALVATGVQGREVITSPLTFSATAAAIILAGGRPVFADVHPATFCITRETVKRVITENTAAILPVHLFGHVMDVGSLSGLGYPIIEDSCQAVGCRNHGRFGGSAGLAGAYSFGSRKQVSAGEGGALVTNVEAVATAARLFMNHGENFGGAVGYNYRPNEATCKLILQGLHKLKDNTPFLRPYLVKQRGPKDKPYIDRTLDKYPAFAKYVTGPLPVAHELAERTLCVR